VWGQTGVKRGKAEREICLLGRFLGSFFGSGRGRGNRIVFIARGRWLGWAGLVRLGSALVTRPPLSMAVLSDRCTGRSCRRIDDKSNGPLPNSYRIGNAARSSGTSWQGVRPDTRSWWYSRTCEVSLCAAETNLLRWQRMKGTKKPKSSKPWPPKPRSSMMWPQFGWTSPGSFFKARLRMTMEGIRFGFRFARARWRLLDLGGD